MRIVNYYNSYDKLKLSNLAGFALAFLIEVAYWLIINFTHIINSPIENYINKSLLYKIKTDEGLKFLNRTLKGSPLKIFKTL